MKYVLTVGLFAVVDLHLRGDLQPGRRIRVLNMHGVNIYLASPLRYLSAQLLAHLTGRQILNYSKNCILPDRMSS